jgi:hypothetical protein
MNEILIRQTQNETRLALEVSANAAIRRIRLARAKLASQAAEQITNAPVAVAFQRKSKAIEPPPNVLRSEIEFRMVGVPGKGGRGQGAQENKLSLKQPPPVVRVECAYHVDYDLRPGFQITPAHIKAFKNGNAIFNAWPYFREYLQDCLQRMGLPPLAAPFLRLMPKRRPEEHTKQTHKAHRIPPAQSLT